MAFNIDVTRAGGFNPRDRQQGRALALPALAWLGLFFILPLLIVLGVSFLTRGSRGAFYALPLTIDHYTRVLDVFRPVLIESIWVALQTMLICLIIGYPLAFFIGTRRNPRMAQFALFLVILPFWTNFLVRTYAWRLILGQEGTINSLLFSLSLITEPLEMINTRGAVLVGLVYGYLPFMVLPIYATVERFDFRLVEAAHDLGANDWRAFFRVVFPLTLPGVFAGCILVFIPTIGTIVTPELLGGTRGTLIGRLITDQFRGTGNWPLGAALSVVMMIVVGFGLILYARVSSRR